MEFLQILITGILIGGLYALLGVAIVLVCKATRVVSLAHGQFLAWGALFVYLFQTQANLPIWLCIIIALAIAAVMGFLVERFTQRPLIGQPLFAAFLITFATFVFLDGIMQILLKGETKAYMPPLLPQESFHLGSIHISQPLLWSFLIALIVFGLIFAFFRYTRSGLAMRITAEDHMVAQSMGIMVKNIFTMIWVISAVVAAVTGILLATRLDITFLLPLVSFKGLVVALFGGLESIGGALVAGLILGIVESLAAGYIEPLSIAGMRFVGVREVAAFVLLLIVLLVKPYGLFGLVRIERV